MLCLQSSGNYLLAFWKLMVFLDLAARIKISLVQEESEHSKESNALTLSFSRCEDSGVLFSLSLLFSSLERIATLQ